MDDKIIGGEFIIQPDLYIKKFDLDYEMKYSLGRTCFYAILHKLKNAVGGLLLPDYLCISVAEIPSRIGIPFCHYHINQDLKPDMESIRKIVSMSSDRKCCLLVSYFGLIDLDETIIAIRDEFPDMIIIVDDVQNFYGFGKEIDYDYCFSSYRKWFPVPDGADVIKKAGLNDVDTFQDEPKYSIYKAAGNLLKNYRLIIGDTVSLELLSKGENLMDTEYRYRCSEISKDILKRIDKKKAENTRKRNAAYLHLELKKMGIEHIYHAEHTPLFIPIFVANRDRIRKYLFKKKIFAPIHWPVIHSEMQGNNEIYDKELSLICDQRYDLEDMKFIIWVMKDAF